MSAQRRRLDVGVRNVCERAESGALRRWEGQARAWQGLVDARDFPELGTGDSGSDLTPAVWKVVAAAGVGLGDTQLLREQEGAGRELERSPVAQPTRGIWGIAEDFADAALRGDDNDRISFVGGSPDVAGGIDGDSVKSFEDRMSHEDVLQTERICGEGRIAPHRARHSALSV